MKLYCVWEHNGDDTLLYADNFPGAYTRGASKEEAVLEMPEEIRRFQLWKGETPLDDYKIEIVQEKKSDLRIKDADSDVLFATEDRPLTIEEYQHLKSLALKSAKDFHALYSSFSDKHSSALPCRQTTKATYFPVERGGLKPLNPTRIICRLKP